MKRVGLWLFILALGAAGALLSGELAIRLWDGYRGITAPFAHNPPETMARPSGYFNFDLEPNLRVTYEPPTGRVTMSTNRWGFRSSDYDPIKPAGTYRVFAFGGSSTFDPFVSDDEMWVTRTGRRLAERTGRRIESVNAGRYGYTTSEILGLLEARVSRHQPDLVILYSTFNDARAQVSPYYGRDQGPQLYGHPLTGLLLRHSALFTFLDFRLRHQWPTKTVYRQLVPEDVQGLPVPPEHRAYMADPARRQGYLVEWYRRNLLSFIAGARGAGARVAFVSQIVNPADLSTEDRLITATLRSVAQQSTVTFIDLAAMAGSRPKEDGLLASYVHMTRKGTAFTAERLSEALAPLVNEPKPR